jgi:hypothetical protein
VGKAPAAETSVAWRAAGLEAAPQPTRRALRGAPGSDRASGQIRQGPLFIPTRCRKPSSDGC